jgi:hypothetical protein
MGVRFYILSVLFTEEELKNLAPLSGVMMES